MRAVSEQPRGEGMEGFVKLLESLPEYRKIAGALRLHNTPLLATGLSNIHKAHFIASLHAAFEKAAPTGPLFQAQEGKENYHAL